VIFWRNLMGAHRARRSSHVPALAGKSALTAAATLSLVGGGAGIALAGEAPSDSASAEKCRIAIVESGIEEFDGSVNHITDGASAPFLEAGGALLEPGLAALCPPASDLLGDNPYNTLRGEPGPGQNADDPVQNTDD